MAGLDCAAGSTPLCVATDSAGNVLTTTDPAAASPAWTTVNVNGTNVIWDVSCPATTFCAAGDVTGAILTATSEASEPVPAITSVSPSSGSTTGGTPVTIKGSGFTGATGVAFGNVPATDVVVESSTKVTAVAPAQPAGLHNVYVTTPGGTSASVFGDLYTYLAPPAITSVSPNSGPPAGGTSVTITGSGFTGATGVAFGNVPATSLVVVSSAKITAVAPAQPAGLHNIYVTTPVGTSAAVEGDLFAYN
jgi:hypothetical protein